MAYGISPAGSFMDGAMRGYGFMDNIYSRRKQEERQAGIDAQNAELHQAKMDAYSRQEDESAIKGAAANMQTGFDPTEEQMAVLQRYGLDNPEGRQEAEKNLQIVESIMQSGDMSKFRSKEGIGALNSLLAPDINSDRKGKPLSGRREIADIMPGQKPGTAVFELTGEYEDGSPFKAPMTEGRGTEKDGDNVVLQQFVGDIAKKLQGQRAILEGYKNDPEFRAKVDAWFKAKGAGTGPGGGELVEVKQGDKIVTMMKKSDGTLVPFAEADRWNPNSGGGKLKKKDIENMAYQRVAKGMGLDSKNYMDFTPQTHEQLSRLSAEVVREYNKAPEQGINAAHSRVMSRIAEEKDTLPEAPTEDELKRAAAELNAEKGNSSDWVPFNEYGVADDEVLARAYQNRENGGAVKPGAASGGEQKTTYVHPKTNRQVSMEEIEQTARNRGMTPEQVINALGLK